MSLAGMGESGFAGTRPPAMFVRRVRRRRWIRRASLTLPIAAALATVVWIAWSPHGPGRVRRPGPSRGIEITRSPKTTGFEAENDPLDFSPVVVTYATLTSVNRTRSADSLWLGPSGGGGTVDILTPADARDESRWAQ